ncbi:glucose-6-phosphate isomerase [Halococcus salsus]|uniref:glucose-6-phosphate isomerase n=1 Tax=Halococcus salsus TaxID=2162894 RepID=UPI00135B60B5|nr:glucose-6-phosphate isomerase [Halococcus salsus]
MKIDIGNALADVAEPGIARTSLDRLDERVATAHERIERGRRDDEFGYAALNLPETTDPEAITEAVEPVAGAEYVLVVGIGGSALGAATLAEALGDSRILTLDNVDPREVSEVLSLLPLDDTVVNVVSRSGTTAETLANFLVARAAFEEAGVDWTERTVVTTGDSGPLRDLADDHDLPALRVPDGVPGRFSALSTVGLVPLAIRGHDIAPILDGARDAADLSDSLYETPGYAYGAVAYALDMRGAAVNAMLPYAESLDSFGEWFAQLWAESLGKDGLGQLPARALGATDQHSQLQRYRAGPSNTLVTFVRPRERMSLPIPETDVDDLAYLGGVGMDDLIDAEFEATEASLAAANRPSVRVEIDRVDGRGIGELLYTMEVACVLAGELYGVETFTQPAVEWGKNATRGLIGESNEESAAVAEKTRLLVE